MEVPRTVGTFVSVGTEVVALCLQEVSRQNFCTVGVVVVDGCGEGRNRNPSLNGEGNHFTNGLLVLLSNVLEVVVKKQVLEGRVLFKGISNLLKELGTDDATFTPDLS